MKRKENFFLAFFVFLFLSVLIFGLSKIGILSPVSSVFQKISSPFQNTTYNFVNSISLFATNSKLKKLENENILLTSLISDQKKIKGDNSALLDQFQTVTPKSNTLLPANVIGSPSFIPAVTVPESLVIDRGENDGVVIGRVVVYKNNLVGKITKVNGSYSEVSLVTNSASSLTVKTLSSQALGVVKGQGNGEMVLDNVFLSDTLNVSDLVLTNGDININGIGSPPDLVVGKILSVEKKASSLFQKAQVKSFIDFSKITRVFVIVK